MSEYSSWQDVLTNAPKPAPAVSVHFLGKSGLIFDRDGQTLYSANTCAAFIWCCLEEGLTASRIVSELVSRFALTRKQARSHFVELMAEWHDRGLLDGSARATTRDVSHRFVPPWSEAVDSNAVVPGSPSADVTAIYKLLGTGFTFDFFDRALYSIVHPQISHLMCDAGLPGNFYLELRRRSDEIVLLVNGRVFESCSALAEVPPMVLACLSLIAITGSRAEYAVHAAAIRCGDCNVLLPGKSGAGKSTLVAALAAGEFEALSDDTVLLEGDPPEIRPLSLGVCLKQGSWECLGPYYPDLKRQPQFRRSDGKTVRYVKANRVQPSADTNRTYPVNMIVFPHFEFGCKTSMALMDGAALLQNLLKEVFVLNPDLDECAIERLLDWMAKPPCIELQYSSIVEAVDALHELCT